MLDLSLLRSKVQLPPATPLLVPAIFLISLGGSLLPPNRTRSLAVTAVLGYLLSQFRHPTGDAIQDGLLPIQGLIVFSHWIDFYVLHDAEWEYFRLKDVESEKGLEERKVKEGDEAGEGKEGEKDGKGKRKRKRMGWNFDLMTTLRGVGWNWRVNNIPEAAPTTKWQFIRAQLLKAFTFYLLFDLIWYKIQCSPFSSPFPPPLISLPIYRQILWTWIPGLESYYSLNMQFPLFAALTVGLGWCGPGDWPPIMGRLRDVETVRDFWGRFWHQGLRRTLGISFQVLTKFVRIEKGSLVSRYGQLYLAFAASAFLHHFPALIHGTGGDDSARDQLVYFLIQPLAITFEDFVIYLGKRAGVKRSWKTRALGKIWTFAWFSCCLRLVFQYNIVELSKPIMPSLCKAVVKLAGRLGKIGGVNRGHEL